MTTQPALPSLDGLVFKMTSSTTSDVNAETPSIFRYHERKGMIWGDYEGDTVALGQFVGTRTSNVITINFVHILLAGDRVVTGSGLSNIEQGDNGLRLVEHYEMFGKPQLSICTEVTRS